MESRQSSDTERFEGHAIVLEPNPHNAWNLVRLVQDIGLRARICADGIELRQCLRERPPELVLLNINLGFENGLDLMTDIHSHNQPAIIIVSENDTLDYRLQGFSRGADDYVSKPFAPEELCARIRAVLRRRAWRPQSPLEVQVETVSLYPSARLLREHINGRQVHLTDSETRILQRLLDTPGVAVPRDQLGSRETTANGYDRSVDVHITNIRQKLRSQGIQSIALHAIRGVGYRLSFVDSINTHQESSPPADTGLAARG